MFQQVFETTEYVSSFIAQHGLSAPKGMWDNARAGKLLAQLSCIFIPDAMPAKIDSDKYRLDVLARDLNGKAEHTVLRKQFYIEGPNAGPSAGGDPE